MGSAAPDGRDSAGAQDAPCVSLKGWQAQASTYVEWCTAPGKDANCVCFIALQGPLNGGNPSRAENPSIKRDSGALRQ